MFKKEFLTVWFIASAIMFAMSYIWHGQVLNDYSFIKLPMATFIGLQALVYFIIGFAVTFIYHYTNIKYKLKYKGFIMGAVLGFCIYLIAYVLGVSFKTGSLDYVVIADFVWQMFEQGVGGGVVGYAFLVSSRIKRFADA